MDIIIAIYVFVLGLCFGSFALAVADREKSKRDWVRGRSICDSCKHHLGFFDLIPVFSWLACRGKCRYCHVSLSKIYPVVELAMGLAFMGSFIVTFREQTILSIGMFVLWLIALVLMMILFIIDARSYFLPYKFLFPLLFIAGLHAMLWLLSQQDQTFIHGLLILLGSVVVGGGIFFILHVVSSGKWIGDGDVFLGFAMGLFLASPFITWFSLMVASILGLVYALYLRISQHKSLHRAKIPFGPFLISGLYIAYLFGQHVIDWYARTVLFL